MAQNPAGKGGWIIKDFLEYYQFIFCATFLQRVPTQIRKEVIMATVFRVSWVLTESRIPLKPILGGVRIVALSISSHEQTQ